MRIVPPRIGLRKLRLANGKAPFDVWLASLVDVRLEQIVDARLTRLQAGNPGAIRNLGGGVWEIIIDFGPGIRIYFAFLGDVPSHVKSTSTIPRTGNQLNIST